MVYICDQCHFEFDCAAQDVEQCPDCGKHTCVRPATSEESTNYEQRKQELLTEKY